MKFHSPRLRRRFRVATAGAAVLLFAACGGGDDSSAADNTATAEDVDQDASATVTEQELAKFQAPADSVLTPQQVEAYIRTSLLQYDLIRKEAPALHARAQKMEERAKDGGALAGLRNMAEAGALLTQGADLIGGSFVRSARTLGHNPAEMEWVRERMGEVSGYLIARPMFEQQQQYVQTMRQQIEEARKGGEASGYTAEMIQMMEQQANEMEKNAQNPDVARSVLRNHEVLKGFRGNVTDPMWLTIGIAGGTGGVWGLTGLADPADTSAQRKLDEFRTVYTDALANRVSQGMEATPPAGTEGQNTGNGDQPAETPAN